MTPLLLTEREEGDERNQEKTSKMSSFEKTFTKLNEGMVKILVSRQFEEKPFQSASGVNLCYFVHWVSEKINGWETIFEELVWSKVQVMQLTKRPMSSSDP